MSIQSPDNEHGRRKRFSVFTIVEACHVLDEEALDVMSPPSTRSPPPPTTTSAAVGPRSHILTCTCRQYTAAEKLRKQNYFEYYFFIILLFFFQFFSGVYVNPLFLS